MIHQPVSVVLQCSHIRGVFTTIHKSTVYFTTLLRDKWQCCGDYAIEFASWPTVGHGAGFAVTGNSCYYYFY